jgi:hypothetical protein
VEEASEAAARAEARSAAEGQQVVEAMAEAPLVEATGTRPSTRTPRTLQVCAETRAPNRMNANNANSRRARIRV